MFGLTSQDGRHRGDTGQGQRIRIRWEPRSRRSSFSPSSSTSGSAEAENAEAIMHGEPTTTMMEYLGSAPSSGSNLSKTGRANSCRPQSLSCCRFFYALKDRPSPSLLQRLKARRADREASGSIECLQS